MRPEIAGIIATAGNGPWTPVVGWGFVAMCVFASMIRFKKTTWIRITRSARIGAAIDRALLVLWGLSIVVFATILVLRAIEIWSRE